MRWLLSIYRKMLSFQIRSQMQYRVSFFFDLVSTGLLNGITFLSLALVLQRFGQIEGWTLGEIAFLAGVAETSFSIMDLVFSGFDPDFFAPNVQLGKLDQFLLRPMNLTWQILASRFVLRRLGRLLEGVLILALAFVLTDIHWTLVKILFLPVVMISQILAVGSLFIVGSTITFWTVQRIEAVNIVTYGGNELMSYPANIYPRWIRYFFTYIIPFVFLNYYPGLYILGKPDPFGFPSFAPLFAPVVGLFMFILSILFWKFGVNHYQSTGT